MRQITWLRGRAAAVALAFTVGLPAFGGFTVGAQIHPANFFVLPKDSGLTTRANFGTGAVFAGLSAGGLLNIQAYLAHDNTGTFEGSGTLFGSVGTFVGKFKVLSYGVELKVSPPAVPLFFKAGIGLCTLTSDVTYSVAGAPVADPFGNLEADFEAHAGLGFNLKLPVLQLFAGLDVVVVKIKPSSTSTVANLSALVYFRPNAGVSLSF